MKTRNPFIDKNNDLIVPLDCQPRFKYWQGGQPIWRTLLELQAPKETWRKHIDPIQRTRIFEEYEKKFGKF